MTPLQSIILRMFIAHPGRSHKVAVDVLGNSDWQYAKKVRAELAMMSETGLLVRTGTSARNWAYWPKQPDRTVYAPCDPAPLQAAQDRAKETQQ